MVLTPLTIEQIRERISNLGFTLLDKEAKGWNCSYKISDKNGYIYYLSYKSLMEGKSPKRFYTGNPFTIENIKNWLLLENQPYELISETYINSQSLLIWRHTNGIYNDFELGWNKFYSRGGRGREVAKSNMSDNFFNKPKNGQVLITDSILEMMKDLPMWKIDGEILELYKGADIPFPVVRDDGYLSHISQSNLKAGRTPSLFRIKNQKLTTFNMYKLVAEKTPHKLKEHQIFKTMESTYSLICEKHGEFSSTLSLIVVNKGKCAECSKDSAPKGENHHSWNPNKTDEERLQQRNYPEYLAWRSAVYERDGFMCQCCGRSGIELNAHHLDGYHWCKERRTVVDNGVSLCDSCHTTGDHSFHRIYGIKNNTKQQFEEWMLSFQNEIIRQKYAVEQYL